jgi:hypothetical protein
MNGKKRRSSALPALAVMLALALLSGAMQVRADDTPPTVRNDKRPKIHHNLADDLG